MVREKFIEIASSRYEYFENFLGTFICCSRQAVLDEMVWEIMLQTFGLPGSGLCALGSVLYDMHDR